MAFPFVLFFSPKVSKMGLFGRLSITQKSVQPPQSAATLAQRSTRQMHGQTAAPMPAAKIG
jgi:hypothetical protein